MSHITSQLRNQDQAPRVAPGTPMRGRVADPAPATETDMMMVIIDGFSGDLSWGPAAWPARVGVLPLVGDAVLVVLDNTRTPWVIGWWPS